MEVADMERDHFKERLPQQNRAGVANWFLMAIRSGLSEPRAVVESVSNGCLGRYRHPAPLVLTLIDQYPDEAEAYAAILMEQENLPKQKRHAERGRRNRMRKEAPTAKQTYAIQKYGQGIPANRVEAHDQINQLKTGSPLADIGMLFAGDENDQ